jgi:pimeloyl-ACP methyl ester carboxylesterase
VLSLAARPFLVPARRHGDPRSAGRAPWQPVDVRSPDGPRLSAWAALRPEQGAPALLFAHGHTSSVEEPQFLASELWERGFNVFVFDFRGCGESEATFVTFTKLETLEVEAAVEAFRRLLPGGTPIGAHGFSMGGAAIINAMKRGLPVARASFDCPVADLRETVSYFLTSQPLYVRAVAPFSRMAAERLLGVKVRDIRPIDGVERLSQPALFILSGRDTVVPPSEGRGLAERWGGPIETWEHPALEHCQARFERWEEYVERLAAWHSDGGALPVATAAGSARA